MLNISKSVPHKYIDVNIVNKLLRLGSNNCIYTLLFYQCETHWVVLVKPAAALKVFESEKSRTAVLKSKLWFSYSPSAPRQFIQAILSLANCSTCRLSSVFQLVVPFWAVIFPSFFPFFHWKGDECERAGSTGIVMVMQYTLGCEMSTQ
jgi:hypothetical protein